MAKCDGGYVCDVCQSNVELISDSQLYLLYVIGELDPELLHTTPERHIRCNPVLAQFIVADDFPPVVAEGPFSKLELDEQFVSDRERLVTRGYQRLREVQGQDLSILDYPLPEIRERLQRLADESDE